LFNFHVFGTFSRMEWLLPVNFSRSWFWTRFIFTRWRMQRSFLHNSCIEPLATDGESGSISNALWLRLTNLMEKHTEVLEWHSQIITTNPIAISLTQCVRCLYFSSHIIRDGFWMSGGSFWSLESRSYHCSHDFVCFINAKCCYIWITIPNCPRLQDWVDYLSIVLTYFAMRSENCVN
jgi:hypothetical protein